MGFRSTVDRLLESNRLLSERLPVSSTASAKPAQPDTAALGSPIVQAHNFKPASVYDDTQKTEFEEDLKNSWVYKRALKRQQGSVPESTTTSFDASWSMMSGLSLGDISSISILALPIYAEDISNKEHYHFGPTTDGKSAPVEDAPCIHNSLDLHSTEGLPPSLAAYFVRRIFSQDLCLVDFSQALKAIHHIDALDDQRRHDFRKKLQPFQAHVENVSKLSATTSSPPLSVQSHLLEIGKQTDATYVEVYIGLRRWVWTLLFCYSFLTIPDVDQRDALDALRQI